MHAQATIDRARAMFLARLAQSDAPEQGPADMPCACTAPQHAHGGPRAAGGCKDTGCTRYRPSAAQTLAERAWQGWWATAGSDLRWHADHVHATDPTRKPREPGQIGVTPSDIGECRRKIWYRETPPEGFVPDPEDKREAMIGGIIHDGLMRARAERYPWRSFERRVLVPGLDREGRYDEYDPVAATLVEVKTAGEYVWERIHEGGPRVKDVQQAQLYALARNRAGFPVAVVKVLYVLRSNGHEVSWTFPYDEKAALAAVDWLLGVVTALDLGDELPRDRTGPTNDPICRRCPAKTHCWNLPAAEAAGRSPESYTVLGPDPDADAIEYQLAQYVDARERETTAKRDKAAAKVLVDGVEAGTYGEYHVGERSSYHKDDAALMDAIRVAWHAPEHERPDLDDLLRNPPKRRVSSVDIGRVSAARRGREARDAAVRAAAAEGGAR